MPFVDRDLAGEDGRAAPIAFLEDLVEVTTGAGVERFEAPIVEDEVTSSAPAANPTGCAMPARQANSFSPARGAFTAMPLQTEALPSIPGPPFNLAETCRHAGVSRIPEYRHGPASASPL